jgi:hypothetical protein
MLGCRAAGSGSARLQSGVTVAPDFSRSVSQYTVPVRTRLALLLLLLVPRPSWAWNATGHEVVARIAWDAMAGIARQRVLALLEGAPPDGCVLELLPADARPLAEREREFFVRVSTWADIVRAGENDTRPCTRFSRGEWHYINYFWQGVSGSTGPDRPTDRPDMIPPATNVIAQLPLLRAVAVCSAARCGTRKADRAIALAWILHLVGDLHQPLHTSARITSQPDERKGDQGGNLFVLQAEPPSLRLHGYWDGILDRSVPRRENETQQAYIARLASSIAAAHPRASMLPQLKPASYDAWAQEGVATCKASVYPATLKRGELPGDSYRQHAFTIARQAVALAGYRLADLLNRMFGG